MKNRWIVLVMSLMLLTTVSPVLKGISADESFILTVKPACGFNILTWTPVENATSYWIYRGLAPNKEASTPLTDFPIQDTTFNDDINIENGKQYCYYVTAVNANAEQFKTSNEACATPQCFERDECKLEMKFQVDNKNYWVNGVQKGPMEAAPLVKWSRTLILIKYVTQEIPGTKLDWIAETKMVVITTRDGHIIKLQIGNKMATVDDKPVQIDPNNTQVTPIIVGGRTLVPFRFVAENLGATGPDDVKWFADTKTIVLYFANPDCDKCEWVKGIITSVSPITATLAAISGFKVEFQLCTGELKTIYVTSDAKDTTGKFPISQYKGCSELCIYKNQIKQWKAYPDEKNCCGVTPTPDCTEIRGKIMKVSPVLFGSTKMWVVSFDECPLDDKPAEYPVETDLKDSSGKNISQYTGCAVICIDAKKKIVKWSSLPDTDCCTSTDCNWQLVKIDKVEMPPSTTGTALASVYCFVCKDGSASAEPIKFLAEYALVDQDKKMPIGRYTGCAKICVGPNNRIVKWIALPNLEDCCKPVTDNCTWVKAKITGSKPISDKITAITLIICGDNTDAKETTVMVSGDMQDDNKKFSILKYTGCAKLCIKDGSITRWIAYPDVKDCCEKPSVVCKTIRGKIAKVTYNENGKRWVIQFEPCNPNDPKEPYAASDLMDTTGKYTLSKYTGCAEICIKDRFIQSWKALPDVECCPNTECNLVIGEIQSTKYIEDEKRWVIVFKPCKSDKAVELFQTSDLLDSTGKFPLSQYKGCAEICIRERTIVTWTAYPDKKCCSDDLECTWVRGKILRTSYNNDLKKWVVYFDDCPLGEPKRYALDNDMIDGTGVFPISQYIGCAKLCIDGEKITKWIAYPDVKDCCDTDKPEIKICFTIEKVNCTGDPPTLTGKDENGTSWTLILTPEMCAKYANYLVEKRCIVVVGYEKTIVTANIKALVITGIRPTECPCKPQTDDCTWHKGVVMHIYSGDGVPADKGAKFMMFFWECVDYSGAGGRLYYFIDDLLDVSGSTKLSLYRGCAEVCLDANNFIVKWKKVDGENCCPPPTRVGRCVNVEGIDCNANPPRFWGKTTWPGELCLVMVTKEQCDQLKVGQCFWVFGKILTPPAGSGYNISIGAESMQAATPCPCPQPTVVEVCIKVERTECKTGQLSYVWGFDKNNEPWWLLVSYDQCSKMTPGTCWKVKGWGGKMANGVNEMENVSAEPTDCSCANPEPKPDCICVTIVDKNCEKFIVTAKDANGKKFALWFNDNPEFLRMCESLEIGATYEVCYSKKSESGLVVESIRRVKTCPDATDCKPVRGKITKVSFNENSKRWVVYFLQCGYEKEQELFTEKDLLDKTGKFPISQYLGCAEICIKDRVILWWRALPNEECCPGELDCNWIKGQFQKSTFDQASNQWVVIFDDCPIDAGKKYYCKEDLLDGSGKFPISQYNGCAKLCIKDGIILKWIAYPDVKNCCEETPTEVVVKDCVCFKVGEVDCKNGIIILVDETGRRWKTKLDNMDICKSLKVGDCVKLCNFKKIGNANIELLPEYQFIINGCACKDEPKTITVCVKIAEVNCDLDIPKITGFEIGKDTVWTLYLPNRDLCGKIEEGSCWIVTGYKTQENAIKVVSVQPDPNCECKPAPMVRCFCMTVDKVEKNCDKGIVYVWLKSGQKIQLNLPDELKRFCEKIVAGSCWSVCGTFVVNTDGGAVIITVTKLEPQTCPCPEPPTQKKCICVTIKSVTCEQNFATGFDSAGVMWNIVFVDKEKCSLLKVGANFQICGTITSTNPPAIKVETVKPVDGQCPAAEPTCICVTLRDTACSGEQPMAYVVDENGKSLTVYLKSAEACGKLEPGKCYRVCGYYETLATGETIMRSTSWENVPCPCGAPKEDCWCIEVDQIDCANSARSITVKAKDGQMYQLQTDRDDLCKLLQPGSCFKVCGTKIVNDNTQWIFIKVTSVTKVDCPCSADQVYTLEVKVAENHCWISPPLVVAKDLKTGKKVEINIGKDGLCDLLAVGKCFRIKTKLPPAETTDLIKFTVQDAEEIKCP